MSKIFSTLFDIFRAGQKTSKIVKKRHNIFRHFSTIFARHQFSGPFGGALTPSEPPIWGRQNGGQPDLFRFLPICSDLRSVFSAPICSDLFHFLPICSDLFRFVFGICSDFFRFVPICSVLFGFGLSCFQNKSEQIGETPFCRPLLQIPDTIPRMSSESRRIRLKSMRASFLQPALEIS